jgi:hypothetical protein
MKIKKFNRFISEGIDSEIVKETGVKYILSQDIKELKDIYEYVEKKSWVGDDYDWLSDFYDLLEKFEIEYDIDSPPFGDEHSSSNPLGIILTPRNETAKMFLLKMLKDINSNKTIENHTEVFIG